MEIRQARFDDGARFADTEKLGLIDAKTDTPGEPEFAFLSACVRKVLHSGGEIVFPDAIDWDRVADFADAHAITGMAWAAVQDAPNLPYVPEASRVLKQRARTAAAFDLLLAERLAEALEAFGRASIRVIPLKGPVLSALLYGNASFRHSSDIDLLIDEQNVEGARTILEGLGYRLESLLPWNDQGAWFRCRDGQVSYFNPAGTVKLDLHWRMMPWYFPGGFATRDVEENGRSWRWNGTEVTLPGPEHTLIFLCAHGARHLWRRFAWVCDIASLMNGAVEIDWRIDWSKAAFLARETDSLRILRLGLAVACEATGVAPPEEVKALIAGDPRCEEVARRTVQELARCGGAAPSAGETARFSLRVLEGPAQKVRFLWGIYGAPTEAEFRTVKLPPALHWLYYPIRPARLTAKYALRAVDGARER